jgi:hypothetical protein
MTSTLLIITLSLLIIGREPVAFVENAVSQEQRKSVNALFRVVPPLRALLYSVVHLHFVHCRTPAHCMLSYTCTSYAVLHLHFLHCRTSAHRTLSYTCTSYTGTADLFSVVYPSAILSWLCRFVWAQVPGTSSCSKEVASNSGL